MFVELNPIKAAAIEYIVEGGTTFQEDDLSDLADDLRVRGEDFQFLNNSSQSDIAALRAAIDADSKSAAVPEEQDVRLREAVTELLAILPDETEARLVELVLAADFNLNRAMEFYFAMPSSP